MDKVSPAVRSAIMKSIPRTDTSCERAFRSKLHRRGYRYRKHVKVVPGCSPDMVFSSLRVVVFIDGDFWHGHDYEQWGKKLSPYWQMRIERNIRRDRRNFRRLRRAGWTVLRVWEHQVNGDLDRTIRRVAKVLDSRRNAINQQSPTDSKHAS